MNKDYNYIANAFGVIFSAIQTNEVLSWISWGLTLIATIVSLAFTIYKWWKKAIADGEITKDELEELGDDVIKNLGEIDHEQDK